MYRPIPQGHRIRSETVKRVTAGNTAVFFFRKQSEAKKNFLSQKLTIFNIIFDVFLYIIFGVFKYFSYLCIIEMR